MNDAQILLKSILLDAKIKFSASSFTYETIWFFDWPSNTLSMGEIDLHREYSNLPPFSNFDLMALEKEKVIYLASEKTIDSDTEHYIKIYNFV